MPSTLNQLGSSHSRRTRSTTDKTALLSALAQELKSSRFEADESAKEMIKLESLVRSSSSFALPSPHSLSLTHSRSQIEEKHSSFISEQQRLSQIRDLNNSQIHSLRRKLASLKSQLLEAQHVKEEEANLYFSLLSKEGMGFSDSTNSTSNPSSSRDQPHVSQRIHPHSTLPAEYGVTLSPSRSEENPYQYSPESIESPLRSPAPYPRATSEVRGSVSPERIVERSEWQDSLFDQGQGQGETGGNGKSGWKGLLGGLSIKRRSSKGGE